MKLLLISFLFFTTYCFSQKQYEFDYLIEYELTFFKDSIKIKNRTYFDKDKTIKKFYLTNSKNNDYIAEITELDSLNYRILFSDQNGIFANVKVLKAELGKAEFININCESVTRFSNPYKYQTKNYDFFNLNDTLINGKNYSKYKIESIKPKRAKRRKLGTEFYIIDKETSFHLPVFSFSTTYEEWKSKRNVPNGLYIEKYFIDYYGDLHSKESLIKYSKIDKKIIIQKGCDYTK